MANLGLIGNSAEFQAVLDAVNIVAPVDSAVLIQGETGTGNEEIARAIREGIQGADQDDSRLQSPGTNQEGTHTKRSFLRLATLPTNRRGRWIHSLPTESSGCSADPRRRGPGSIGRN